MAEKLIEQTHRRHVFLGVDTGGTFTDFVLVDGETLTIHKVLSTPDDPSRAIFEGLEALGLEDRIEEGSLTLVHGSTVATNAALEGKGVRTAYLANKGLADVLTIGRQARTRLYDLMPEVEAPPVGPELCIEVDCRVAADGSIVTPLSEGEIKRVRSRIEQLQPEAIAINLLFSFLAPDDEKTLQNALADCGFVSRSSEVLPVYKEYERGIATWLNASLGPKVSDYLARLTSRLNRCVLSMMQSSGGCVAMEQAAERAVNLLLSGPAGGLAAVKALSQQTGFNNIISFDMGGTSTDVALYDGEIRLTQEGQINRWPVAVPMVDMVTIGAGGGSIAWIDEGGMCQLGPRSAGSHPGPACYGRGGKDPTVTDAHVVLGHLSEKNFAQSSLNFDAASAHRVVAGLGKRMGLSKEDAARGILDIAEQHMSQALREVSIQRGIDPSGFVLCCFGGAGGLHVCALAEQLGIGQALVPANDGVLSALGMLTAPRQRQLSQTHIAVFSEALPGVLESQFRELEKQGKDALLREGIVEAELHAVRSLDMRYQGQSYTLNVEWGDDTSVLARFGELHQRRYGHNFDLPVEVVNLRVSVSGPAAVINVPKRLSAGLNPVKVLSTRVSGVGDVPVHWRDQLEPGENLVGPTLIADTVSTTWLRSGWKAMLDEWGNLLLERII